MPSLFRSSRTRILGAGSRLLLRLTLLFFCLAVWQAGVTNAAGPKYPKILKVLPHFLDLQGRHTLSPSLFDRDAYQFELRNNPELRSGFRFDVLWKTWSRTSANYTLKLEMRGSKGGSQNPVVLVVPAVTHRQFSRWTRVPVTGKDYDAVGELVAWRVSLWQGDEMLAEQKSFLW